MTKLTATIRDRSWRVLGAIMGASLLAAPAAAQPFYDGEIIGYSPNYPLPAGNGRAIVRINPIDHTQTVLFAPPYNVIGAVAYDPFRDMVLIVRDDAAFSEIDLIGIASDGTPNYLTTLPNEAAFRNAPPVAPTGNGVIYYALGRGIGFILPSGQHVVLLDLTAGAPFEATENIHEMYFEPQHWSLYIDQHRIFGGGADEVEIWRIGMPLLFNNTPDSINIFDVAVNPTHLDPVSHIGEGPSGRVFFTQDVNDNGLYRRAGTVNTSALPSDPGAVLPYATTGFFKAGGTNTGVYSPLMDEAVMFSTAPDLNVLFRYPEGTVDSLGEATGLKMFSHGIDHMTTVRDRPCFADFNGDGYLDNGDLNEFLFAFIDGYLTADFNGDGFLDNGDIIKYIGLFLAGC